MSLTYRELSESEFAKIPLEATAGFRLPPGIGRVIAAFDGDDIVAVCGVLPILHLEPLWVAENHRGGKTIKRLWDAVRGLVKSIGAARVFIVTSPNTERIARWCGAVDLGDQHKLLYLDVGKLKE